MNMKRSRYVFMITKEKRFLTKHLADNGKNKNPEFNKGALPEWLTGAPAIYPFGSAQGMVSDRVCSNRTGVASFCSLPFYLSRIWISLLFASASYHDPLMESAIPYHVPCNGGLKLVSEMLFAGTSVRRKRQILIAFDLIAGVILWRLFDSNIGSASMVQRRRESLLRGRKAFRDLDRCVIVHRVTWAGGAGDLTRPEKRELKVYFRLTCSISYRESYSQPGSRSC